MWILQTLSCENLFIHYECTSSQLTICHHFWVGATANPPKSDDSYAKLTRSALITYLNADFFFLENTKIKALNPSPNLFNNTRV